MSTVTITPGGLFVKTTAEDKTLEFDWRTNLAAGVQIATSTFTVATIRPADADDLTIDDLASGLGLQSGNRTAKVEVSEGTEGAVYRLTHTVVTDETPAQTKQKSIKVKVDG
jgi:hypothetical protein